MVIVKRPEADGQLWSLLEGKNRWADVGTEVGEWGI